MPELALPDSSPLTLAERISFYYTASLDNVANVNTLVAQETRTEAETNRLRRDVEHLELMLAKDWWTDQDLAPLQAAVAAGRPLLP